MAAATIFVCVSPPVLAQPAFRFSTPVNDQVVRPGETIPVILEVDESLNSTVVASDRRARRLT